MKGGFYECVRRSVSRPSLADAGGVEKGQPDQESPRAAQAGVPGALACLLTRPDPVAGYGGQGSRLVFARRRAGSRETSHLCFCRGFTRPPAPRLATTPTNRPRRSLSSPGDLMHSHCRPLRARENGCAASTSSSSARGPEARWRRAGWPRRGWRSRSSRTARSAASAPSGPACRPRGCCARARSSPRYAASRAPRKPSTGSSTCRRRSRAATRSSTSLDDSAQLPWLEERGIALYRGWGRLDGEKRVVVGEETIEVRRAVFLAGGTTPALPPIDGLADAKPWTNREATTARRIPRRLIVMGGGVVGVEMSQAYCSLGAGITLIEGERRLLPREEEFACEQVTDALAEQGVDIRTGQKATAVRRDGGEVSVTLGDGATVTGDELLVAVGRTPQVEGLGLESVGLEPRRLRAGRPARPRRRPRLALRDRRSQRPRAVHPHGQVPGAHRRRPRARQGQRGRARRRRARSRRA